MWSADLLPYITSLGALFVLVGFVMLVWTEGTSHQVSTLAFISFVVGVVIVVGSLYVQDNPPESVPVPRTAAAQSAISACLTQIKNIYVADLKNASISCSEDALGNPNPRCVTKSEIGAVLYRQLLADNERCFATNAYK